MMALLLCGLLLLSPADTVPVATPPPTEAEDVIEAVDLAPWDDLFSRMEDGEAWQRPSLFAASRPGRRTRRGCSPGSRSWG